MRTAVLVGLLAAVSGCSAAKGAVTVDVSGATGQAIPATSALDVLVVDVAVNSGAGTLVVDTGSPIVALDPASFRSAGLSSGARTVTTLALGGLTFMDPAIVTGDLVSSPDPTLPIDGSLGCAILCAFAVSLDYRGSTVTLSSSPPAPAALAGLESPGAAVPFSLEGGGTMTIDGVAGPVVFPPSRVRLAVMIEGAAYSLVVDSGSSLVLLRESLFESLVTDGRTQLEGVGTSAGGASSTSKVTRVRSFVVGGEEVAGLVASADPSLEASLDSLASEVGEVVHGLIGGSFLREFYVTVDYPSGVLHLRRYTQGAPTFDRFDRVGLALSQATVTQVFAGTNAATAGVSIGDTIVSIDGTLLAGLGSTAADTLLAGPVGSTKSVAFGAASSPTLSMKTVSLSVDDILPL